jgi:hypothetical protein
MLGGQDRDGVWPERMVADRGGRYRASLDELCPAVQGLLADRPVMDILGFFGRLAQAKVDPGCCRLPVVSVRHSRLGWDLDLSSQG